MTSVSEAFRKMGEAMAEAMGSGVLSALSDWSSVGVSMGDAYDGIGSFLRKRDADPKYDEALNLLQHLGDLIGNDTDRLTKEELWLISGIAPADKIYEYLEEEWAFQWDSYEEEWR